MYDQEHLFNPISNFGTIGLLMNIESFVVKQSKQNMKIEKSLWLEFLAKMYAQEHLFLPASSLGTIGLLEEIEKFVIANMPKKRVEN